MASVIVLWAIMDPFTLVDTNDSKNNVISERGRSRICLGGMLMKISVIQVRIGSCDPISEHREVAD